jgi:hypothetical protein
VLWFIFPSITFADFAAFRLSPRAAKSRVFSAFRLLKGVFSAFAAFSLFAARRKKPRFFGFRRRYSPQTASFARLKSGLHRRNFPRVRTPHDAVLHANPYLPMP